MIPIESSAAFGLTAEGDPSASATPSRHGKSVLQSMLDPVAALEAARRLYREHRSGLRFFCENGQTLPIDHLSPLDGPVELTSFGDWTPRTTM